MSADDGEPGLRLEAYLPYRLAVASDAVSGLISRAYQDRFGLSVPQWRVMCVLAAEGGVTQGQIVTRTFMDKVTVSRAAHGLAARALVDRAEHHADGRSHVLTLTAVGRRLFSQIAPLALAYEAALIAGLAPDEVNLLRRMLLRLQAAAAVLAGENEPSPVL